MTRLLIRSLLVAAAAVVLLGWATPAAAQNGALKGKVVTQDGRPVDAAEIILDFVGDVKRQIKTVTDKNGEWIKPGIPVLVGTWTITAKKGNLEGSVDKIAIKNNETQKVADIVMLSPEDRKKGVKPTAPVNAEEAAANAKKQAETDKLLEETNAAIAAGNNDEAITKLKALIDKLAERNDKCAPCHAKLGEIYLAKKDNANAEAAFLKAIEVDPAQAGPYSRLASLYNEQKKFDEASKMSAKANELAGASGGDAASVYNQGVIFWNQSKVPEAKAQFEKAVQLDPKMADAHYWLGMANLNQGNMADAKKAFQEYMKLAPTGQYAETTKAILAQIK